MTTVEGEPVEPAGRPVPLSHRRRLLVVGGVGSGMFLTGLMQSIVSVALPSIVRDLGGFDGLGWVVIGYLLAQTSTVPLWGKLGDVFGRRTVFRIAIVVFMTASTLSGLSTNLLQLVGFRVLQGIGGAGIFALAFTILGDVLPPRQRGRYQGYMTGISMISSLAGPLVGGFLVDNVGWRSVFWVNLPAGAVALVIATRALPKAQPAPRDVVRFDYFGSVLLVSGVSSLMLMTTWGGERGWASSSVRGLGGAAAVLLTLFFLHERRTPEPLLPLRLLGKPEVRLLLLCGFVLGVAMHAALVFVPLFLQMVSGTTAMASGLLMVPMMGGVTLASFFGGSLVSRTGAYRVFLVAGSVLLTAGYGLLTLVGADSSPWIVFAMLPVLGLGVGLLAPTLTTAVQNAVPFSDLGVGTSTLHFVRMLGMVLGTAVFSAIFNASLNSKLQQVAGSSAVRGGGDALRDVPEALDRLPPAARDAVAEAFAASIHSVFVWMMPACVAAVVISLAVTERPLRDDDELDVLVDPASPA